MAPGHDKNKTAEARKRKELINNSLRLRASAVKRACQKPFNIIRNILFADDQADVMVE
jgi:hypothetical protein